MQSFSELLDTYMRRTGINDSELARTLGISRQTVFRWKQGLVARPRHRDDVLVCARRLRLTSEERDLLLLAAGFAPEVMPAADASELDADSAIRILSGPASPPASPPASLQADGSVSPQPNASIRRRRRWRSVGAATLVAGTLAAVILAAPALRRPSYPLARSGETLVLVAAPQSTAAPGRIEPSDAMVAALQREISGLRLAGVRAAPWPAAISDAAAAEAARLRSGAAVLAWRGAGDDSLRLATGGRDSEIAASIPLVADREDAARIAALVVLADAMTLQGDEAGARSFLVQALSLLSDRESLHGLLLARLESGSNAATPTTPQR